MGYISQTSATPADSEKITISIVFEVATAPGFVYLISWGDLDTTNDPIRGFPDGLNSYIAIDPSFPPDIFVQIRSPLDTIHGEKPPGGGSDFYDAYAPGGGTTTRSPDGGGFSYDIYSTAIIQCLFDFADFVVGQRYHILIALDISASATLVTEAASGAYPFYSYRFTGKCFVNGVSKSVLDLSLEQDGGAVRFDGGTLKAIPSSFDTAPDGTLPIWPIGINGKNISVPGKSIVTGAIVNPNAAIKCGGAMVWVNQYIDPTSNISTFYRDGGLVDPAEAIAAFGTPDFDIRGPAASVTTNHGSAGDFAQTGTVTDSSF